MLLYLVAVFLLFEPRSSGSNIGELVIFALTFVGGSAAFALGYESVIILGGKASLRLVEFMSGLNGSKHIIEVKEEEQTNTRSFIKDTSLLYIPVSVFVI